MIVAAVIVVLDQITKAMVRPALALHESVEVIPGFLDLTRVHNTGAAFGMLNGVDFPMKTLVLSCVAADRARRRRVVRGHGAADRSAGAHRRGRRAGRRHRQPDRSRHRRLRARLRRRLLGRLALLGLQRRRRRDHGGRDLHDSRYAWIGQTSDSTCIQSCLTLVRSRSTRTACCSPRAYLLGLWLAVKRARAAGIDGNRIMDLLIWVIIAALVGAKALLFIVDFRSLHEQLAGVHHAVAVGRRVLRRADRGDRGVHLAAAQTPPAAVAIRRFVRARHRARLHGGPARLPDGRLLLRQTHRRAVGGDVHGSGGELQCRHAAQCGAAPDPAV